MHNITLVGARELVQRFQGTTPAVHAALLRRVQMLSLKLQAHVITKKLSGQVLNRRSGALSRSIKEAVDDAGNAGVYARVFSSGDVKYAGIHEFGGTIKHPGGTKFYIDKATGRAVFISNNSEAAAWAYPTTRPHDIPMPARSFLRSSLKDMQGEITVSLRDAVVDALRAQVMGKAPPQ